MRGRAIGLGLLGLGAFVLAAALAVRLFLEPALVKLPLDQKAEPVGVGTDVSFFNLQDFEQFEGLTADVQQRVEGDAFAPGAGEDVAVWNFGSTVSDTEGNLLNASTYRVCLDRRTAEAVPDCESTHVDYDRSVKIEGLTLTFPFGTEQRDYKLFNATTGEAFPAEFIGTEEIKGLEVYRFEQTVPETVIEEAEVPGELVGADDELVNAEVVYSNQRTVWVEPASGVIVKSEEHPDTVLRGPDGEDAVTLLAGTFGASEATVDGAVERAENTRSKINWVATIIPLLLLVLGVFALVAGALLLRRRPAGAHREDTAHAGEDRVPQVQ
jgi:hypothetical protein